MENQDIIRTDKVMVRVMKLAKYGVTEWHYHSEVRDFFVCLQGAVLVETREPAGSALLLPGQRLDVAPLKVHRVANAANEASEYLLIQGVGSYDFCQTP
jgi:quercetin dioxygenase-like cupin family protein